METEKNTEANVKLTVYLPAELREKVELFGQKTFRNLSLSIQYFLETHPELKEPENAQLELSK